MMYKNRCYITANRTSEIRGHDSLSSNPYIRNRCALMSMWDMCKVLETCPLPRSFDNGGNEGESMLRYSY